MCETSENTYQSPKIKMKYTTRKVHETVYDFKKKKKNHNLFFLNIFKWDDDDNCKDLWFPHLWYQIYHRISVRIKIKKFA